MITLSTALYVFLGIFVASLTYMAITKKKINLKEADLPEQGFDPMSPEKRKELIEKGLLK